MKLRPNENEIAGNWSKENDRIVADYACNRITTLLKNYLKHIADHPESGAWESLFLDPADGRFWERIYPNSEMHGGGPPLLRTISKNEAKIKYRL